jgi:dTDP-4-amino-4,6-dideoxygalactose transaminase
MRFVGNLVVDPDPFYCPKISISPFSNRSISPPINKEKEAKCLIGRKLKFSGSITYTESGKQAIAEALASLNLMPNDIISIVTTSKNSYVSKCVTDSIKEYCNYEVNPKKLNSTVYLIHEFGSYFDPEFIQQLTREKHTVINDYAYTLLTILDDPSKFHPGDFSILSFPKHFPINYGGALLSSRIEKPKSLIPILARNQLLEIIQNETKKRVLRKNIRNRKKNYWMILKQLNPEYFKKFEIGNDDYVPSVLMFRITKEIDFIEMRAYMNRQGIESSAFFGLPVYFVPIHQNLSRSEMRYISEHLNEFVISNDK